MKKKILFCTIALLAGSLFAADSSPKDDVIAAAKKLGDETNYTWNTTVVVPDDAQFKPGPTDGKTEKDGFTSVKMSFGDNDTQFVLKGTNAAITNPDGDWQSLDELQKDDQGPGRFMVRMVQNFKAPDAQAVDLANAAKELKQDGDMYSGDLTDDGAKNLIAFRRGGGANVTDPSGSVKFWLKDGELTKFEFKLKGKIDFNGNDFDVDRDTTVEIKDVGTTKLDVPDEAKKKLP